MRARHMGDEARSERRHRIGGRHVVPVPAAMRSASRLRALDSWSGRIGSQDVVHHQRDRPFSGVHTGSVDAWPLVAFPGHAAAARGVPNSATRPESRGGCRGVRRGRAARRCTWSRHWAAGEPPGVPPGAGTLRATRRDPGRAVPSSGGTAGGEICASVAR